MSYVYATLRDSIANANTSCPVYIFVSFIRLNQVEYDLCRQVYSVYQHTNKGVGNSKCFEHFMLSSGNLVSVTLLLTVTCAITPPSNELSGMRAVRHVGRKNETSAT